MSGQSKTIEKVYVLDGDNRVWELVYNPKRSASKIERLSLRMIYAPEMPRDISCIKPPPEPYFDAQEYKCSYIGIDYDKVCLLHNPNACDWHLTLSGDRDYSKEIERIIIHSVKALFLCKLQAFGSTILHPRDVESWETVKAITRKTYEAVGNDHPAFLFSRFDSIKTLIGGEPLKRT